MIFISDIVLMILVLMDCCQTAKLFVISKDAESNGLLKYVYTKFGIVGVHIFKIGCIIPVILIGSMWLTNILIVWYLFVVISNILWFKEYNKSLEEPC